MLRNSSEKIGSKFPATALGYSVVTISCLDDTFAEILKLKARLVEGQQLQQKDKKGRKCKAEKKLKIQKG